MIIYVSYYNHVFSRSDEQFLQYIKSIKGDDFPVIFIVNAVDLMKAKRDAANSMNSSGKWDCLLVSLMKWTTTKRNWAAIGGL